MGKTELMPRCQYGSIGECAEIIASSDFDGVDGIFDFNSQASGAKVDHLIFNGNNLQRISSNSATKCATVSNAYGFNVTMKCDDCVFTNSISKNSLCGTALGISSHKNAIVSNNLFAFNGFHNKNMLLV